MRRIKPMRLFVYGTLKPGEERWPLIESFIDDTEDVVGLDVEMRDYGPFPVLQRKVGGVAHGVLVTAHGPVAQHLLYQTTQEIEGALYQMENIGFSRVHPCTKEMCQTYLINPRFWPRKFLKQLPVITNWTPGVTSV